MQRRVNMRRLFCKNGISSVSPKRSHSRSGCSVLLRRVLLAAMIALLPIAETDPEPSTSQHSAPAGSGASYRIANDADITGGGAGLVRSNILRLMPNSVLEATPSFLDVRYSASEDAALPDSRYGKTAGYGSLDIPAERSISSYPEPSASRDRVAGELPVSSPQQAWAVGYSCTLRRVLRGIDHAVRSEGIRSQPPATADEGGRKSSSSSSKSQLSDGDANAAYDQLREDLARCAEQQRARKEEIATLVSNITWTRHAIRTHQRIATALGSGEKNESAGIEDDDGPTRVASAKEAGSGTALTDARAKARRRALMSARRIDLSLQQKQSALENLQALTRAEALRCEVARWRRAKESVLEAQRGQLRRATLLRVRATVVRLSEELPEAPQSSSILWEGVPVLSPCLQGEGGGAPRDLASLVEGVMESVVEGLEAVAVAAVEWGVGSAAAESVSAEASAQRALDRNDASDQRDAKDQDGGEGQSKHEEDGALTGILMALTDAHLSVHALAQGLMTSLNATAQRCAAEIGAAREHEAAAQAAEAAVCVLEGEVRGREQMVATLAAEGARLELAADAADRQVQALGRVLEQRRGGGTERCWAQAAERQAQHGHAAREALQAHREVTAAPVEELRATQLALGVARTALGTARERANALRVHAAGCAEAVGRARAQAAAAAQHSSALLHAAEQLAGLRVGLARDVKARRETEAGRAFAEVVPSDEADLSQASWKDGP